MPAERYRKRPVLVDAIRWDGEPATFDEILEWSDGQVGAAAGDESRLAVTTLEGVMHAEPGDWIIRGVEGEHYPCKPSVFEATYEPAFSVPFGGAA